MMSCESLNHSTTRCSFEIEDETHLDRQSLNVSISMYTVLVAALLAILSPSIYAIITSIWIRISQLVWDQFTVSIEVSGPTVNEGGTESYLYYGLINWFSKTYPDFPSRTALATFNRISFQGGRNVVLATAPGFGTYYIQYKDHWVRIERFRLPLVRFSESSCETLILTAWAGQQSILNDILAEVMKKDEPEKDDKVYILQIYKGQWIPSGPGKIKRPQRSVILDSGILERIFTDVYNFLERREWYLQRDIPHRRGFLLYGPPGCGKTTLVKAIAGELHYNICVLSLSAKDLTDDGLLGLMQSAPANSIILMEDIDAAFKSRADKNATSSETNLAFEGRSQNSVTFRGLLNALDGVASSDDGRIICMTTNYVEKLDPALIRCGRVDLKIFIDYPSDIQLRQLFKRFYDEASENQTLQFIKCVRELKKKVSIAMIQGLFLIYKDSAEDAIKYSKEYFEEEFSVGESADAPAI